MDVLKVVAGRGPLDLDELEAAMLALVNGANDGFWNALDAVVDHGCLQPVPQGESVTHDLYRLTSRGRRLLLASSGGNMAA